MNADIKKLWVDALRSREYQQSTGQLNSGNGFCCLGVLCDLHSKKKLSDSRNWVEGRYLGNRYILTHEVVTWAGIESIDSDPRGGGKCVMIDGKKTILTEHNDQGKTFDQIATAIEEQL